MTRSDTTNHYCSLLRRFQPRIQKRGTFLNLPRVCACTHRFCFKKLENFSLNSSFTACLLFMLIILSRYSRSDPKGSKKKKKNKLLYATQEKNFACEFCSSVGIINKRDGNCAEYFEMHGCKIKRGTSRGRLDEAFGAESNADQFSPGIPCRATQTSESFRSSWPPVPVGIETGCGVRRDDMNCDTVIRQTDRYMGINRMVETTSHSKSIGYKMPFIIIFLFTFELLAMWTCQSNSEGGISKGHYK